MWVLRRTRRLISRELLILAVALTSPVLSDAAEYFIAPNGRPSGNGSATSPWDISTGLRKSDVVKNGDTVWLRAGTYGTGGSLRYSVTLAGKSDAAPVIVRGYRGEHAKVNAALEISGSHVWLWDFEITNTDTKRKVSDIDDERPRGVLIKPSAVGAKLINLVIHDVGRAGVGGGADNFEIYGTLFWGNGIFDKQVRGDAVYLNYWNTTPDPAARNLIRDNIAFRNLYAGFKIYSEWAGTYIDGFELDGNISFDNGARDTSTKAQSNILVRAEGGAPPIRRLKVLNNFTYRAAESTNPYSAEFGCKPGDGIRCQEAEIRGNYFAAGRTDSGALLVNDWDRLEVTGNTIVGSDTLVGWTQEFPSHSNWNNNTFIGGATKAFRMSGGQARGKPPAQDFNDWRKSTQADRQSSYSAQRPTGVMTVVRKNQYEPGRRAHIVIYNWELRPAVIVDLTPAAMPKGSRYEILDAQNYFGKPIVQGTFGPKSPSVTIPMNLSEVAALVGEVPHVTSKHTAPEFGVFILRVIEDLPRPKKRNSRR